MCVKMPLENHFRKADKNRHRCYELYVSINGRVCPSVTVQIQRTAEREVCVCYRKSKFESEERSPRPQCSGLCFGSEVDFFAGVWRYWVYLWPTAGVLDGQTLTHTKLSARIPSWSWRSAGPSAALVTNVLLPPQACQRLTRQTPPY